MPLNLKLLNSAWQYHMLQMFRIHGTMTLCCVWFPLHDGGKVLKLCCLVLDVLHALVIITRLNVLQVFQLRYRSMIDLHWSQTLLCERYIKQFFLFHYSDPWTYYVRILVVKDWLDKFLKKTLSISFWLLFQVGPQDHTTLSSVSWQMVPGRSVALVFLVEPSILHSTIILGMRNWVKQRKLQQHKKCCPKFNSVQ